MDFTTLALPLFAFYLLVFCNFTPEIIGCKLKNLLSTNMVAKHVLGFVLLLFLVVLVNPENADEKVMKNIGFSIIVYLWFLITIRNPYEFIVVILLLLLIVYLLGAKKARNEKEGKVEKVKSLHKIQLVLTGIAFVLSVIGLAAYYLEKKDEYKGKFAWDKFIIGNKKCKNN